MKSAIAHNKGKAASLALILILTLSSAIAIANANITVGPTTGAGNNPGAAASVPQQVAYFDNGYQILAPTQEQIANWSQTSGATPFVNGVTTFPIFTVAPDPIGVGQQASFIMGLTLGPPTAGSEFGGGGLGQVTNPLTGSTTNLPTEGGWGGYTLKITEPDGNTTTFGPYVSNVSGLFTFFAIFDTVGAYTATFNFPGEIIVNCTGNWSKGNAYFLPLTTTLNFTVQQNAVNGYTPPAPPSRGTYWSQPVPGNNRPWNVVCGPWVDPLYNETTKFNPYTYAPATAHIIWQEKMNNAIVQGGLVGGDYGSLPLNNLVGWPTAVNSYFGILNKGVIVIGGYVYYNSGGNGFGDKQFNAMRISDGKIIWSQPGEITTAQLLNWRDATYKYVFPYLWYISGSTWYMYDANSGQKLLTFANCTTGTIWHCPVNTTVIGMTAGNAGGGDLRVLISGANSTKTGTWLACWSMTRAEEVTTGNTIDWLVTDYGRPGLITGATIPWASGLLWNNTLNYAGYSIKYLGSYADGKTMIYMTGAKIVGVSTETIPMLGVDVSTDDVNGPSPVIWTSTDLTYPRLAEAATAYMAPGFDGTFTFWFTDIGQIMGFSTNTGKLIWATNITKNGYGNVQTYQVTHGYGMLYYGSYDGYVHAVSLSNGTEMWASHSAICGFDFPSPYYPFHNDPVNTGINGHITLADYKVYDTTGKDHESEPLAAGHAMYCFDAITGAELWNLTGQYLPCAIADGIMLTYDNMDGMVYAFGTGQSATTVSAPLSQSIASTPVVIQGSVSDQSPEPILHGTPAIADAWQSEWMGYMLMDQPYPSGATGVPVEITAIDPNNNFISIANVTSDIAGNFHYVWTPQDIPGTYQITATFPGSEAYYGSCAETTMTIGSASQATASPTTTPTSVADMYFVPAIAGLFVLIIVVAIVLALLMLRKRP